jgi:catechol 2,3-dioxygenase-like lactoylglutathione lyase family enzyme
VRDDQDMTTPTPTTSDATARPAISIDMVVLDTDDPAGLARFYSALLDLPLVEEDEDWVTLGSAGSAGSAGSGRGGVRLAFQLAINHRRPTWPSAEVPQQYHLDLRVQDMDAAVAHAESLGAVRLRNAGGKSFTVLLDPSGHPFCLCR